MKETTLGLLFAFIVLSIGFISCNNDNTNEPEEDSITNKVNFSNVYFELSWGTLEYYGKLDSANEGYNYDITLFSPDFEYDAINDIISGVGSAIYFEIYSDSETELSPGTYTFDPEGICTPYTFDEGDLTYRYNTDTELNEADLDIASGTIKIEKTDDSVYEITINCKSTEGIVITGYYKGTLIYKDISLEYSSSAINRNETIKPSRLLN
ncbi:MAG: hypothetical protein GXO47_04195 [Chlorobi bacterium]|nr:hypothetical protein [Chlorobiota bacterium]